jgi:hypothetical protein
LRPFENDPIDGDRAGKKRREAVLEDQPVEGDRQLPSFFFRRGMNVLQNEPVKEVQVKSGRGDPCTRSVTNFVENLLARLGRVPIARDKKNGEREQDAEDDQNLLQHCKTA